MTATVQPDVDVWAFQDVEVPCDILSIVGVRCDRTAGWIARSDVPCHQQRVTSLMCDMHKDYLLTGATWWCPACNCRYTPTNTVIEPL